MHLDLGDRPEHVHKAWRAFLDRPDTEPVPECGQIMSEPLWFNRQEIDGEISVLRPNLLCELWWQLGPFFDNTAIPKVVGPTIVTRKGVQA